MQQIGTWVSEAGTFGATLEMGVAAESDELKLPSWATGALQGAAAGAATGMAAGPYGALIGGIAGATIGGVTAAAAQPPAKPAPPRPAPKPAAGAPRPSASVPRPAASTPAPPPAPPPRAPVTSAPATTPSGPVINAAATQALQQFAAIVPALIQLVSTSNAPAVDAMQAQGYQATSDASAARSAVDGEADFEGFSFEGFRLDAAEWAADATESTWSVP